MNAASARAATPGLYVVHHDGDGSIPPVVMVHGGMDRSTSFGRVVRKLGDVPVTRYDRRGYGRSSVGSAPDIHEHVDDLLTVIGDTPSVVFGHSLGGLIALMAAERRPDLVVSVLAYEPPTPWIPEWPKGKTAAAPDPAEEAERFMRRMVGDRIWERLPQSTRADRRAEGVALAADLASVRVATPLFDSSAISVPVLCSAGSEGDAWHRAAVERLAADLPNGDLQIVNEAGHGVHLTHPSATAELVLRARSAVA